MRIRAGCVSVVITCMVMCGCMGHKTRTNVLLPSMRMAWKGIRVDAQRGGAQKVVLDSFEQALSTTTDKLQVVLQWPPVRTAAQIGAKLGAGELLVNSRMERIKNFDDGVNLLKKGLIYVE